MTTRFKQSIRPPLFRWWGPVLILLALIRPAGAAVTIDAVYVAAIGNGLNPTDPAWSQATATTVALDSVIGPTGVPQLLPTAQWRYLQVRAIHNGNQIFFRYEWADGTNNLSVADTPLFADAVAMEIPFTVSSSIAMGNQREPVNILYWRADLVKPENLVSGGAGTVQKSPDSEALPISHSQSRTALPGSWTVIIQRPLQGTYNPPAQSGNLVTLNRGGNYRICFAQWDGAQEERNGLKMVAGSWQTLQVH
ncbi:MAG: ethylbenzene dehydrogenase-related protein [Desulfobacterota bacterium]|nr:ethylbenzene dehydrogenase-related protein [Thermodesulfobacteriota bacterium]